VLGALELRDPLESLLAQRFSVADDIVFAFSLEVPRTPIDGLHQFAKVFDGVVVQVPGLTISSGGHYKNSVDNLPAYADFAPADSDESSRYPQS
jgi:hypothetical protein